MNENFFSKIVETTDWVKKRKSLLFLLPWRVLRLSNKLQNSFMLETVFRPFSYTLNDVCTTKILKLKKL